MKLLLRHKLFWLKNSGVNLSILFIAHIIFLKYFFAKIPSDFSINGTDFLFNLFCLALEVAILFNWKRFEPIDMSSVFDKDVFDKYKEKIRKIRFSLFALVLVLYPFLINFIELSRSSIPSCNEHAYMLNSEGKEALWDKYYTGAPAR